jgi:predicted flap endonuclease-1-like 5' DNA nuclease
MDFRDRQRAVRQDARSLLDTIRAERMERRRSLGLDTRIVPAIAPIAEPAAIMETITEVAAPPAPPAEAKPARKKSSKPKPLPKAAAAEAEPAPSKPKKTPAPKAVKPAKKEPAPVAILAPAPMLEVIPDAPMPEAVLDAPIKARAPRLTKPKPVSDSISMLPGIGPGLVWRLNRLGIATFADLAASDVARIRHGLGRLHRLAPLDHWIAHAVNAAAKTASDRKQG